MTQESNDKLVRAGFTILRLDDWPSVRLKYWKPGSGWNTFEKFETKSARKKRIHELRRNQYVVFDSYDP
ncbi:MAG: hypothetical protein IJV37_05620 [Bacteroidales bacterium]|nr:hypothetical protein [Bacteroidales bacterium]